MSSDKASGRVTSAFERWLESLRTRDPDLHRELLARRDQRLTAPARQLVLESGATRLSTDGAIVLETIVREGRPAVPVRDDRIVLNGAVADSASRIMIERLVAATPFLEPLLPLVGRIDVSNYPGNVAYVGTGWLVDRDVVITNCHVAELIARHDGRGYLFRAGRFGDLLEVDIDYRREMESEVRITARVTEVIWIEPDVTAPDIAFLRVGVRSDGSRPGWIDLASEDASPDANVATIGYPARASSNIIPDQAWMERIYGGTYDIKRVAPGKMTLPNRGWATHDCTTLGGNSGSVVVDLQSGKAVGLHFAGKYMVENYAIPVSLICRYLRQEPWREPRNGGRRPSASQSDPQGEPAPEEPKSPASALTYSGRSFSVTIPLTITVSFGVPVFDDKPQVVSGEADGRPPRQEPLIQASKSIEDVARALARTLNIDGVLAVRPGYVITDIGLSGRDCLVLSTHPARLKETRLQAPDAFEGLPVEVRPAPIGDQLGSAAVPIEEAVTSVAYNNNERRGSGFQLRLDRASDVGRLSCRTRAKLAGSVAIPNRSRA